MHIFESFYLNNKTISGILQFVFLEKLSLPVLLNSGTFEGTNRTRGLNACVYRFLRCFQGNESVFRKCQVDTQLLFFLIYKHHQYGTWVVLIPAVLTSSKDTYVLCSVRIIYFYSLFPPSLRHFQQGTEETEHPTRPVQSVALTTKGLQETLNGTTVEKKKDNGNK